MHLLATVCRLKPSCNTNLYEDRPWGSFSSRVYVVTLDHVTLAGVATVLALEDVLRLEGVRHFLTGAADLP